MERVTERVKVAILGAAGRDFHNFNMVFRDDETVEVVAFTAAQIRLAEGRRYPAELAGPLYPGGIPILPEAELEELIRAHGVGLVIFSYSDVSHEYVMHRASAVLALGADFCLLGPERTMLEARKPVVSVCAVRTGCGKSGIARFVVRELAKAGLAPVVVRHPMAYGDLVAQRCQRFATLEDLDRAHCTLEEREEYAPHLRAGAVVYAGVDYREILDRAQEEAEALVWDGGNNDLPFLKPDLEIVVLDPHRAGHERTYHPGETNLRRAHVAVVNKTDTANPKAIEAVEKNMRKLNPEAAIVRMACPVTVDDPDLIRGKRVLAVEDGPTLTHGGMGYGAATLAARKYGATTLADARPHAVGSIREAFARYPHLTMVLPALGYSSEQLQELRETIETVPCDTILLGTPVDLQHILGLQKPLTRARYEPVEVEGDELARRIRRFAETVQHGGRP